ncbi:MAG: RNA polymerase sigma factor [Candidatus Binataceae bacterium]
MGKKGPEESIAQPGESFGPPTVEPLTHQGCKRLSQIDRQIRDAIALEHTAPVERTKQRDKIVSPSLSPEAIVYFIRRASKSGDHKVTNLLFTELFERCVQFFRGQFRGFDEETRQELQQSVLVAVTEDLLASDDRGDFAQVRFWRYLKTQTIDACRKEFRKADSTESLDAPYPGGVESEGRRELDRQRDKKLTPEELTVLSKGLERLPPKLRKVFVMRHALGFEIGSDDPNADDPKDPTLARHFNVSGRTIRNWLKQADDLLASLREI